MAVRHEVENLIRRGNIFYWRAYSKLPATRLSADVFQSVFRLLIIEKRERLQEGSTSDDLLFHHWMNQAPLARHININLESGYVSYNMI